MQLAQNHQKNFRPEEMQSKHVNNSFLRPNEFTLIYFLKNGTLWDVFQIMANYVIQDVQNGTA